MCGCGRGVGVGVSICVHAVEAAGLFSVNAVD